ncbi:BtrH N-terminal domain-containing protein [Butyrivibrio sp. YAB3001]|uniref:BtrH N-terminal domain-containing protein n=1 Tax=Butyrivibrio sp. YAB3001 TaxID=1520812 RepID=UPI0008F68258|nr:BtrH N-terminal domain-containing protein [Butyrivibrio sp. YAB3001]SFC12656.1 Butirosin biosynthesis protein H, N-terminal [Butyrivibrio sp. YAB3001]
MILDEYTKYHGVGSHCATTILRTLTNAAGYPFSEAMCLGLASGLGFTYQKYVGVEYYFFTGRNECLEENMVNVLGGKLLKGNSDDNDKAWSEVCYYLDRGLPVILEVDMMKLPYIREKLNLKREFHFGLHSLLLIGYDEENAYVLDYMWWKPIQVPIWQLKEARNSMDAPIRPHNRWKVMVLPEYNGEDLSETLKTAIRVNVHKYKEPYAFKMGLDGLRIFQNEFSNWFTKMPLERLQTNFYMMSALFEKVGTGGGNFRRMYGQFLDEANKILVMPKIAEAASIYTKLYRNWKQYSKMLENDSEKEFEIEDKEQLVECIRNLYSLELEGVNALATV